jgi:hypothetical protein
LARRTPDPAENFVVVNAELGDMVAGWRLAEKGHDIRRH